MAKKKTFIEGVVAEDNPALQFISTPKPAPKQEEPKPKARRENDPPEGYKLNPMYIETKSRRLQLVLQPSLYERVKEAAQAKGVSVNEYIHNILDIATREE